MKAEPPVMLDEQERGHSYPPVIESRSSPFDWSISELGEFAEFKNGINFTKTEKGAHGVPTLDVRNMYGRGVTVDCTNLYRVSKRIGDDHLLRPGDLLFVRSSLKQEGIGWTSLFIDGAEPTSFCGFIIRARIRSGIPIDPLFLVYFCRSSDARNRLIAGSGKVAITNISQDVLARLPIPVPPLPEQKKIAAVLSVVQQAVEQQERLITLTAELKKALLRRLFTRGLNNEPQKLSDIGLVPESWELVKLSDVCTFQSGGTPSKQRADYWEGTIPWVSPKDMKRPRLTDVTDHISQEALEEGSKLAPTGSVFVVVRGMILAKDIPVALAEVPMAFNQDMKAIIPGPRLHPDFLLYAMSAFKKRLFEKIGRSAHGTMTLMSSEITSFQIPMPDKETQRQIANILAMLEKKQALHQRKHATLTALFRSLLHHLMTAEIRVHDLDLSKMESAVAA
ncbi:type I restriction enzyme S subunit [Bradyrhizobium diazoefficiens]|uniref:restriction endonuclease subunit S n=1 Tax=Bradyrhizobium diazoefficiens TaxID=1355477 RepID=UPI0035111515